MDARQARRFFKEYVHDLAKPLSERHAAESAEADRVFDEIAKLRSDVDRALEDAAAARTEAKSIGEKLDNLKVCFDEWLVNGDESGC